MNHRLQPRLDGGEHMMKVASNHIVRMDNVTCSSHSEDGDMTSTVANARDESLAKAVAHMHLNRAHRSASQNSDDSACAWSVAPKNYTLVTAPSIQRARRPHVTTTPLNRAQSTDSVDSNGSFCDAAHADTRDIGAGQLEVRIAYDLTKNALTVTFIQLCQLHVNVKEYTSAYVLAFLLPHLKPLWRTEDVAIVEHSPIYIHQTHYQCVRPQDLRHLTLLCKAYAHSNSSSAADTLIGETSVRIKDIAVDTPTTLWLTIFERTNHHQDYNGQLLISLNYEASSERLNVIVMKLRHVETEDGSIKGDQVQMRAYLVVGAKASKKKSTVYRLMNGACDTHTSMQFHLPAKAIMKASLRVSVARVYNDDATSDSPQQHSTIGHVTLGARHVDKALGHWQKMLAAGNEDAATMWHNIVRVERKMSNQST